MLSLQQAKSPCPSRSGSSLAFLLSALPIWAHLGPPSLSPCSSGCVCQPWPGCRASFLQRDVDFAPLLDPVNWYEAGHRSESPHVMGLPMGSVCSQQGKAPGCQQGLQSSPGSGETSSPALGLRPAVQAGLEVPAGLPLGIQVALGNPAP